MNDDSSSELGLLPRFIDFEATGLHAGSVPIEVAWSDTSGRVESLLIRPDESWLDLPWDPIAEQMHGISQDRLMREGLPVAEVCGRLDDALRGFAVYCDALIYDRLWLSALYDVLDQKPAFDLRDVDDVIQPAEPTTASLFWREHLRSAALLDNPGLRLHRAADDVRLLVAMYQLARNGR